MFFCMAEGMVCSVIPSQEPSAAATTNPVQANSISAGVFSHKFSTAQTACLETQDNTYSNSATEMMSFQRFTGQK